MHYRPLKRFLLVFVLAPLVLADGGSPEVAIIGTWKFVGYGDIAAGGKTLPKNSKDITHANASMANLVDVKYQFYRDGTVSFVCTDLRNPNDTKTNIKETGTYKLIADGSMLQLRLPPTSTLLVARRLGCTGRDILNQGNVHNCNIRVTANSLTLQYDKPGSKISISIG